MEGKDDLFSLQGPTVIGTVGGNNKLKSLKKSSADKIKSLGVKMMIE